MANVSIASGMVPVPSNVAVATTSNYIGSADLIAGGDNTASLHKRDVDEQLIKRYGDQGITGLLELVGSKKETTQQTFEHYEETLLHNHFEGTVGSSVLNIEDTFDDGGDGSGNTGLRVGDLVLGADNVMYYVSAASAAQPNDDFTLKLVSDGTTPVTVAKQFYTVVGNAHAERSGQPDGLTPRVHQYSNKCQIIKESFTVSGSEATNAVYVKVNGGYLWYLKGEADTYQRFNDYAEMQCVIGQSASGLTDGASGKVETTEGLVEFVKNKGQQIDIPTPITMTEIDNMVKSLDKYRGAKEMALYAGIDLSLDIDDLLSNQSSASGVNYGTFANNKDMALNLGFNSFTRGGYTFHKKTYDLFNRPDLLGGAGFTYSGSGIIIPMDSQKDAKSGEKIPSLRVRYKAANGYSREMEHWLTGGAVLQDKTNEKDELRCNYRTERGFEGFAPNRFMWIEK